MKPDDWLDRAERRLRAADALFEDDIYEDALFLVHQSVEVAFKAVIASKTERMPPRVHSLQQLAKLAGFEKPQLFALLEPAYVGVRYPDAPLVTATKQETHKNIELARRVLEWSRSQLK
ncbi:MAG: HEPN domain-containing protein [Candidatus Aenigmarchaeota archaeon]|nr:HEPN domain-containing protein [Candidatus Aenigmarchaeota archaeon]